MCSPKLKWPFKLAFDLNPKPFFLGEKKKKKRTKYFKDLGLVHNLTDFFFLNDRSHQGNNIGDLK
jgi:hypothetical protein